MDYPKILDFDFEPGMDKPINSALIRAAFEALGVKYDPESDSFVSKVSSWAFRIEDWHDDRETEPKPHYILAVGSGDWESCDKASFRTRYCDYHSTTNLEEKIANGEEPQEGEAEIPLILNAPGAWTITVWLPRGTLHNMGYHFANTLNQAYVDVMAKVLPDYFIPNSEMKQIFDEDS